MAKLGQMKRSVSVFVSSTFTDMQEYRRKVQAALTQLETIVRGMEQFGSKPGSPVEECLRIVGSCTVYVGIFGMRYGSIPDGHESSMTHLEYDEAQRLGLPSLIYILDENQPIPAKDVETGTGAKKLRALKKHLKKRHLVSFYTTPEDLQARLLHDVPALLKKPLPKLFQRRSVTVDIAVCYEHPTGYFRKEGDIWREYPAWAPGKHFTFKEYTRHKGYIYLVDPSRLKEGDPMRPMHMRLPVRGGMAQWSWPNPFEWSDIYIVEPQAYPPF
jgi:hypothetical protein